MIVISLFITKLKITVIAFGVVTIGCVMAVAQVAGGGSTPFATGKWVSAPDKASVSPTEATASATLLPFMNGQPAPINEYKGMQDREEVFEFSEKPKVVRRGDKWVITFATKAKCDVTVSILDPSTNYGGTAATQDKDGLIIRHLASGVLGKNAPYPFQQDSLAQKLEWDGLTDDFKKAPAGCKVRVSLGLTAKFERNIGSGSPGISGLRVLLGKSEDGTMYVGSSGLTSFLRTYDKEGKYLRTIIPAPASEIGKAGIKMATTTWGDKVPVADWFGVFGSLGAAMNHPDNYRKSLDDTMKDMGGGALVARMVELIQSQPGVKERVVLASPQVVVEQMRKVNNNLASSTVVLSADHPLSKLSGRVYANRLSVDRQRELLYTGLGTLNRFDGNTGELDKSWKPLEVGDGLSEFYANQGGKVYIRSGGSAYGYIMFCVTRDGKIVPFRKNVADDATLKKYVDSSVMKCVPKVFRGMSPEEIAAVYCGAGGFSACWQSGLHVSPNDQIATVTWETNTKWGLENGLPKERVKGPAFVGGFVQIWTPDGDFLTAQAVEGMGVGQNTTMDRDGNIYTVQGCLMPDGQKCLEGITDVEAANRRQGGAGVLIKFRGQGGKYPVGKIIRGDVSQPIKLQSAEGHNIKYGLTGALWTYGGITGQSNGDCNCNNQRFDQDPWARLWIGSTALFSVMVLDANGNRIARLGRYGNDEDTVADLKEGKDGLRFAWSRSVAASDRAFYVADSGNERILKAAISYAVEETVELED